MAFQTTLAGPAVCAGVGLHSGAHTRIALSPAPAGTGVVFRRADVTSGDNVIPVHVDAVSCTRLNTTLSNPDGVKVATVEHLLAAIAGMGLDNVFIDINGPETPAMDGSAAPFAKLIRSVGLRTLGAPRKVLRVLAPVDIAVDGRRARFEPADGLEIDVAIEFDNDAIGRQHVVFAPSAETFLEDVGDARTFALSHDVEALRASGLALGGSLENCVLIDDGKVVNEGGLRHVDEFVRHKALDALGDLAVAGVSIIGRYVASRPGHAINNAALRELLNTPDAWRLETLPVPEPVTDEAVATGVWAEETARPAAAPA